MLVRLGELDAAALRGDPAVIADQLWRMGAVARGDAARGCWAAALDGLPARLFTPVWLLDGLDELVGVDPAEPALWETRVRKLTTSANMRTLSRTICTLLPSL